MEMANITRLALLLETMRSQVQELGFDYKEVEGQTIFPVSDAEGRPTTSVLVQFVPIT